MKEREGEKEEYFEKLVFLAKDFFFSLCLLNHIYLTLYCNIVAAGLHSPHGAHMELNFSQILQPNQYGIFRCRKLTN